MDADGSNRQRLTQATGADTAPRLVARRHAHRLHEHAHRRRRDLRDGRRRQYRDQPHRPRCARPSPRVVARRRPHRVRQRPRQRHERLDDDRRPAAVCATSPANVGRSTAPAYSPDGDTIAFVSDRGGSKQVWLMDADGSRPRQLTTDAGAHSHPTWAPAGKRLAFAGTRTGHGQIWVIRRNGSALKNLSKSDHADSSPSWS